LTLDNHPDYHLGWWDSLRTVYLDEINDGNPTYGVSKGRFAAIMSYLSMALKETHTHAEDMSVTGVDSPGPGVPILFVGAWGEDRHFGAGLTPLPDSSLLVYRTIDDHPLGLVPGDIVLGYDGTPWKELYLELIEAQLPIAGFDHPSWAHYWETGERAITHCWLMAAGLNWHLFDTLDVVKYSTGDTMHFPTNIMIGQHIDF